MAESVVVGVRVRPFNPYETKHKAKLCIEMNGATTIIKDHHGKDTRFTFDESFWSHDGFTDDGTGYSQKLPGSNYADQRHVFDTFGQRVLDNAWEGFHCCLFAYGQTGAGKSYSMLGYGNNQGIVPIACEEIFKRIERNENPEKRYEVSASIVEIYMEKVQDLLILPEDRPAKGLAIQESKLLGIHINGVIKKPVRCYKEIEAILDEARRHQTVGCHLLNQTSSRAHTVLTIEFKQVERIAGKDRVKISMVNLVDLAGSEKTSQAGTSGDTFKEGVMINTSLSALGHVIEKLADQQGRKKDVHVPYRSSKLTHLLQNALGGSSKTIMICALSPASSNYSESMSSLRYADRVKKIKNHATVNENPQDRLLRELKEENMKLKQIMEQFTCGDGQADKSLLVNQQKEIAKYEEALLELQDMEKSVEERVQESLRREEQLKKRRTSLHRSHVPMLVNLNEDKKLTGRLKYVLPEGKVTRVGRPAGINECESDQSDLESSDDEDEPDIVLQSDNIHATHATIVNNDGECWLHCERHSASSTWINGAAVSGLQKAAAEGADPVGELPAEGSPTCLIHPEAIKLSHGDRIVFANNYFFLCLPLVFPPDMMITSKQVDYAMAFKEMHTTSHKVMMKLLSKVQSQKPMDQSQESPEASTALSIDCSEDVWSAIASPEDVVKLMTRKDEELKEALDLTQKQKSMLEEKDRLIMDLRRQVENSNESSSCSSQAKCSDAESTFGHTRSGFSQGLVKKFDNAFAAIDQIETSLIMLKEKKDRKKKRRPSTELQKAAG